MSFNYHLEIRQRNPDHTEYMKWKQLHGAFNSRADLDHYADYVMRHYPKHDVRGIRKDGTLTHRINYRVGSK